MIQVYKETNSDFSKNGDITLTPTVAYTESELNGSWSAFISHPIDEEGRWEYLTEQAVVRMPSWNGSQLFRVAQRTKSETEVTCVLYPIFYDSMNDCFLIDVRPTNKNGQDALNIMLAPNAKYSAESDILTMSTAYYEYKNFMEALNGEDNSFINRWGGEIVFDNYKVKVKVRQGADHGLEMRYAKNIESVTEDVDMSSVITRLYPKAYNGRTRSSYVDSPLINSYPTIKTATMTFDKIKLAVDATADDYNDPSISICENQAELDAALATACQGQFDAGLDKPVVNISITGVFDLAKIQGYEQFSQPVDLGDTVHLRHSKLDIVTDARIIYLKYDSIRERTESIEIGRFEYDYFRASYNAVNKIDAVVRDDFTIRAETVKGTVDMKRANLYAQYDQAERQDVLGILFENNDATSPLYGAMALGTQGFMIADTKDAAGNWQFNTLGTAKGIVADYIVSGILQSMDGSSYWDLNNSEFVFSDDTFDSQVRLDEGFIQFLHKGVEFAKILRRAGEVLYITAKNGFGIIVGDNDAYLVMNDGSVTIVKGDSNFILGGDSATLRADSNNGIIMRKSDGVWLSASALHINGFNTFTGTKTISGTTLTFQNGILVQ